MKSQLLMFSNLIGPKSSTTPTGLRVIIYITAHASKVSFLKCRLINGTFTLNVRHHLWLIMTDFFNVLLFTGKNTCDRWSSLSEDVYLAVLESVSSVTAKGKSGWCETATVHDSVSDERTYKPDVLFKLLWYKQNFMVVMDLHHTTHYGLYFVSYLLLYMPC